MVVRIPLEGAARTRQIVLSDVWSSEKTPLAPVWQSDDVALSLGIATLLFAVIFRLLPQTPVSWRDVFGGALLTAIVFGVAKHLFAWYLGNIGSYAAYGAVGAVLGLLLWIYVVSVLVFLGAEFTRVYAERRGSLAP